MRDTNLGLRALNWCWDSGAGKKEEADTGKIAEDSFLHDFVLGRVSEHGLPQRPEQPEEALRALLKAKAGYELGRTNVESFVKGRVALPESLGDCPLIQELVPDFARDYLKDDYAKNAPRWP